MKKLMTILALTALFICASCTKINNPYIGTSWEAGDRFVVTLLLKDNGAATFYDDDDDYCDGHWELKGKRVVFSDFVMRYSDTEYVVFEYGDITDYVMDLMMTSYNDGEVASRRLLFTRK